MAKHNTYPEAFVVNTALTPNGIAWGIRDWDGKSYDIKEAKRIWFEALEKGVDIDCNIAFARLVERNFDPVAFDEYLNEPKER